MAIERIEEHKQLNGVDILKVFTKPTAKFPDGFFYAPIEAIDLVQSHTWFIIKHGRGVQVIAHGDESKRTICFHKELFKIYQSYEWDGEIDHINMCEFDNTDDNLNAVSKQQNKLNVFTKGYQYNKAYKQFRSIIVFNADNTYPFPGTKFEDEVCIQQRYLINILRNKMGDSFYKFDFLKYRRNGSEDLIDLERTGVISAEEAVYRHVLRYADNAWVYLRFNLEQYFRDNNIPTPKYLLDSDGYMIHPITKQRLCLK